MMYTLPNLDGFKVLNIWESLKILPIPMDQLLFDGLWGVSATLKPTSFMWIEWQQEALACLKQNELQIVDKSPGP